VKDRAAMHLTPKAIGIIILDGILSARWPINGKHMAVNTMDIIIIFLYIFNAYVYSYK